MLALVLKSGRKHDQKYIIKYIKACEYVAFSDSHILHIQYGSAIVRRRLNSIYLEDPALPRYFTVALTLIKLTLFTQTPKANLC